MHVGNTFTSRDMSEEGAKEDTGAGETSGQRIDVDDAEAGDDREGEADVDTRSEPGRRGETDGAGGADRGMNPVAEKWHERLSALNDRLSATKTEEERARLAAKREDLRKRMKQAGILEVGQSGDGESAGRSEARRTGAGGAAEGVDTETGAEPPAENATEVADEIESVDRDSETRGDAAPDDGAGARTAGPTTDGASTAESTAEDSEEHPEAVNVPIETPDDGAGDAAGSESASEPAAESAANVGPAAQPQAEETAPAGGEAEDGAGSTAEDAIDADSTAADSATDSAPTGTDSASTDDESAPTDDESASTGAEVEALRRTVSESVDRIEDLERMFDEYKRRNEHEHDEIRKYAVEDFAGDMLRVRETLRKALEFNDWEDGKADQIRAIVTQFDQQFTARSIEPIDPERGAEFDSFRHEMVDQAPSEEFDGERVVRVERKGFELSERVIRPAQVVVAERE